MTTREIQRAQRLLGNGLAQLAAIDPQEPEEMAKRLTLVGTLAEVTQLVSDPPSERRA